MSKNYPTIQDSLSAERLKSYLIATGHKLPDAMKLYEWNITISAAFYQLIADVEVVIRNSIHRQFTIWNSESNFGGQWYDNNHGLFDEKTMEKISKARNRLVEKKKVITPDAVIAQLSFGFWNYLLTTKYKTDFWPCVGRYSFPRLTEKQPKQLFKRVGHIWNLRNRIAHYEPIHTRKLDEDLNDCFEIIGAVCPVTCEWSKNRSKVELALQERPLFA